MIKSREKYDNTSINYRFFNCHRCDIDMSKNWHLKRRYDTIPIISIYRQYIISTHRYSRQLICRLRSIEVLLATRMWPYYYLI